MPFPDVASGRRIWGVGVRGSGLGYLNPNDFALQVCSARGGSSGCSEGREGRAEWVGGMDTRNLLVNFELQAGCIGSQSCSPALEQRQRARGREDEREVMKSVR